MKISFAACLIAVATTILLSEAGNSNASAQPGSLSETTKPASSCGRDGPAAASYVSDTADGVVQGPPLEGVLGREVRTRDDDPGRIIDLLAGRDGWVQAAVVELGGFMGIGSRKIAVDWNALRFECRGKQSMVVLDLSRDQLRQAPEFKPSEPVVMRNEK